MNGNNEEVYTKSCEPCLHFYSTKDLEELRFANVEEQRRKWEEVYQSLESDVAVEYDGLQAPNNQRKKRQQKKKKKDAVPKITEVLQGDNGIQIEEMRLQFETIQEKTLNGRRSYSRSEMKALRFMNVEKQQRLWKEVHHKPSSDVAKEFDGLWVVNQKDASKTLGEISVSESTNDPNVLNLSEPVCVDTLDCSENGTDIEEPLEEYDDINDEDDSSSDEYESIQKPAFMVEGEPDFKSGPPLDGLEYLRRVRWEAAQIPKVKVVRLNSTEHSSEQTHYMPSIPEIPKCPSNLLPSEAWEKAFLTEFSELRQAISNLDDSCNQSSLTIFGKDPPRRQSDCIQHIKNKNQNPTLPVIFAMDAISRAATLRNGIRELENDSILSRNDCLWLFALCAAVDTPLHADTCASLRCLLRKCSALLSLKSERDEEVVMLSILITICGKYFGQLESFH